MVSLRMFWNRLSIVLFLSFLSKSIFAIDAATYLSLKSKVDVNGQPLAVISNSDQGPVLIVTFYDQDGSKQAPIAYLLDSKEFQNEIDILNQKIDDLQSIINDIDAVPLSVKTSGLKTFR